MMTIGTIIGTIIGIKIGMAIGIIIGITALTILISGIGTKSTGTMIRCDRLIGEMAIAAIVAIVEVMAAAVEVLGMAVAEGAEGIGN